MISIPKPAPKQPASPAWHRTFLALLPTIESYAHAAFGHLGHDARAEAVAEATAHAMVAVIGLVERGKDPRLFPGQLAHFAVLRVKAGRLVAGQSAHDVLSPMAQQLGDFEVHSLDDESCDPDCGWKACVALDSKNFTPADAVAFRLDFDSWLNSLRSRDREVGERLAVGDRPGLVASKLGLAPATVSRLRWKLQRSWERLQSMVPVGLRAVEVPA